MTMTDYHQRFRERFPYVATDFNTEPWRDIFKDILAFIDEVGTQKYADGFKQGRFDERMELIEKIEGMRKKPNVVRVSPVHSIGFDFSGPYNTALDDLLTYLRAPEKEETGCCEHCECNMEAIKDRICHNDECTCHLQAPKD